MKTDDPLTTLESLDTMDAWAIRNFLCGNVYPDGSQKIWTDNFREQEENTKERRKSLPMKASRLERARARSKSFNDSFSSGFQSHDDTEMSPDVLPTAMSYYFVDHHVPRSVSPLGFDGEHDTTTSSAFFQLYGQPVQLVSETHLDIPIDSDFRLPFGSLVETQYSTHESLVPTCPFLTHPNSNPDFVPSVVRNVPLTSDILSMTDALTKDPEALLDTKNSAVVDVARTDPSIVTMALITALGLLSSHSSNPRVAVFQLSAAAVSFTLIALHAFHSKEANAREHTLVQRLLKYFPVLIFTSCWILFLLSITLASPKAMAIVVCLVVLASIPMVGGTRLPAAVTLAIMTFFSLTFFAFVFLVCVLPTEWLA